MNPPATLRERWAAQLQKAWYAPHQKKSFFAWALLDVSWAYRAVVALRRWLYRFGAFKTHRVPVPVIVVGNVVAGGAGKTPVTIALARHLAAQGRNVGIISRGYGRSSIATLEVTAQSPVLEVGDEPALIKKAQAAPVFVARKRIDAARALLAAYPQTNVIVCDDGLQHLALHRDVEICVFDERGVGNGWLLPAGPLREPWPRVAGRDVDFVLRPHSSARTKGDIEFHLTRQLAPRALRADGTQIALIDLKATPVIALAAIANPEQFFNMLRSAGIQLHDTIALPDHYQFDSFSRSISLGYSLICTEKDAIKLWRTHPNALAVPLVVDIAPAFFTALDEKLSSVAAHSA
jgi:tetraacyldisaccharide 4'-kinase